MCLLLVLFLTYGIGRNGCHFSGDDWGIVLSNQPDWWFLPDWMWSYNYPNNVINEGIPSQDVQENSVSTRKCIPNSFL